MTDQQKEGVVQAHQRGFGFVQTNQAERFFVPPAVMRKLLPGDVVTVTLTPGKNPGELQVDQLWLVERAQSTWLGAFKYAPSGNFSFELDDPCFLRMRLAMSASYQEGDVILVSTPELRNRNQKPIALVDLPSQINARMLTSLGSRNRPNFEQDYALAKYKFEPAFSPEAEAQCTEMLSRAAPALGQNTGHTDLTAHPFITIDSSSTQDFDDALCIEATADGFRVLVAIADVSHYVQPGSPLDSCAFSRGTSVYLPGKTVPMLPKGLSAGLCALKANAPRLAVVLELNLDPAGTLQSANTVRALITVRENLTYDYVQQVLLDPTSSVSSPEVTTCINELGQMHQILLAKAAPNLTAGVESPEPVLSATGELVWVVRHTAHKLVECFMLLANQHVANILIPKLPSALFRHQALPNQQRWDILREWAATQGLALPPAPERAALAALSGQLPLDTLLTGQLYIRAAMSPAIYDESAASHFSLGYETYTHFTSPIRRYADLVVHRLLLNEPLTETPQGPGISEIALHCSDRSRAAKFAERHVWDKLKKRALYANQNTERPLMAYVVSQSKFGLRAVVLPWQCVTNVSGTSLQAAGLKFNQRALAWEASGIPLIKGSYVLLKSFTLEDFKAATEVHATLVSALGLLSEEAAASAVADLKT